MRQIVAVVCAAVLILAWAPRATATSYVAESIFDGTVTDAPADNIFGVRDGSIVTGEIFYLFEPPDPCLTASCEINSFGIGFQIGQGNYMRNVTVTALTAVTDTVTLTDGLISSIIFELPPDPCLKGSTTTCPALGFAGNNFFTVADCAAGQVCGTLDFANSAPRATPLPAALPLFATGLGAMGLLGWRRKRKNAAAIAAA